MDILSDALSCQRSRLSRSKSQYIAAENILSQYSAKPLINNVLHNHQLATGCLEEEDQVIGIQISSWSISTRTSTIASEKEIEVLTNTLEQLANDHMTTTTIDCEGQRKRRLSLPESLYIHASVNLVRDDMFSLSFDAMAALSEWSHCHSYLNDETREYRGVSILKSIDGALWSQRVIPTDFYFDWSYSTPYTGTSFSNSWIPSVKSGFNMTLLTDRTLPILYYDEIKLYEDDMHDNGYTSLTCKLRVMPTCLLILMTLFVRIDYVLIRVKETRIFIQFGDDTPIWREISWKECKWSDLDKCGLPTKIPPWRIEDNTLVGNELQLHQQRIQAMIRLLPMTPLPPDLPKFSHLKSV
jgi:hypothetical protein